LFSYLFQTLNPLLWLSLGLVWVAVWFQRSDLWSARLKSLAIGLVATLPVQAMTLQWCSVDGVSIAEDLLGRYPQFSVNFGGFKISYLLLRPLAAFAQTFQAGDALVQLIKALHCLLATALFAACFRILPIADSSRHLQQLVACLGFLVPSLFFPTKILNYDALSNGFALLAAIAAGRCFLLGHRRWAWIALAAGALGYAEKVSAVPFLFVALVAMGWASSDRSWQGTARSVGLSLGIVLAPALIVVPALLVFATPGPACQDTFGSLLIWTYPLRQLPVLQGLTRSVGGQVVFSLAAIAGLVLAPRYWPHAISHRFGEWRKWVAWGVSGVTLLGCLAPHLISPEWMFAHNVPPGIVTSTPLNGLCTTYGTTLGAVHVLANLLHCCWQLTEWLPTVILIGLIVTPILLKDAATPLGSWLFLAGLGYLFFYALTRNPVGHRYLTPAGIALVLGLLEQWSVSLRQWPERRTLTVLAIAIACTGLELGRYWPCVGPFRPMVMPYRVTTPPGYADAKAPWMGWGEEAALSAYGLPGRNEVLHVGYGRVLGVPGPEIKGLPGPGERFLAGAAPDELVLISRSQVITGLVRWPRAEPQHRVTLDGWDEAWVFRVGDVFPETGHEPR
jgi:hypothetical protein